MGEKADKETTGAWVPRVFFAVILLAVVVLVAMEARNAVRKPSLSVLNGPAGMRVHVYACSGPGGRDVWLLAEPRGLLGKPVCFQHILAGSKYDRTGTLYWSADGLLLAAAERQASGVDGPGAPLWIYEMGSGALRWRQLPERPCGIEGGLCDTPSLVRLLEAHGGRGAVAMAVDDFGEYRGGLRPWQLARWENVLPRVPGVR